MKKLISKNSREVIIVSVLAAIIMRMLENIYNYDASYFELAILVFVLGPIIITIHELGHVLAIRCFKGNITKITIGKGNILFALGLFEFRLLYFAAGRVSYEIDSGVSNFARVVISASGAILNILTATIICLLLYFRAIIQIPIIIMFMGLSLVFALVNLVPINIGESSTDGKKILYILKGSSKEYEQANSGAN